MVEISTTPIGLMAGVESPAMSDHLVRIDRLKQLQRERGTGAMVHHSSVGKTNIIAQHHPQLAVDASWNPSPRTAREHSGLRKRHPRTDSLD